MKKSRPLAIAMLVICVGCTKTCQFQYPNSACKINSIDVDRRVSIRVNPIRDGRGDKSSTEGWSMLAFIPFVPYVDFHNYDMTGYNSDVGSYDFNPLRQLHEAAVEHLRRSGLFRVRKYDAFNTGNRKGEFSLNVNLVKLGIEGCHSCYCLGLVPGCYVHVFGAPMTYATSYLTLEIELLDDSDRILMKKTYSKKLDYKSGLYYHWNNLNYVGRNFCGILNDFCSDAADVLETVYVKSDEIESRPKSSERPKTKSSGRRSLLEDLAR